MFTNKTVFILGAGASWHYGYPTGEQLVERIVGKAEYLAETFRHFGREKIYSGQSHAKLVTDMAHSQTDYGTICLAYTQASEDCANLAAALRQVQPPVIDYFLGQNRSLQTVGKLLIAWAMLDCEAIYERDGGNQNRRSALSSSGRKSEQLAVTDIDVKAFKDNWYRYVVYKCASGCDESSDLARNDVTFVTFNYDLSLEQYLYKSLRAISLFQPEDIEGFLSPYRVLHVYGKLREGKLGQHKPVDLLLQGVGRRREAQHEMRDPIGFYNDFNRVVDAAYTASKGIRVINPTDKGDRAENIGRAREAIARASCVYILGYGFDENNSKRLGLYESLKLKQVAPKSVMFTNYGDINRINRKASEVLFGSFETFLPPYPPIHGHPKGSYYCEKSVRTVYEALELDFDSLEEQ